MLSSDDIGKSFDATLSAMSNKEQDQIISALRDMHIKMSLNEQRLTSSLNQSNKDRSRMRERTVLLESRINKLNSEKGILLAEHGKLEAMNGKLQELSRELQKKNKLVSEESQRLIQGELTKRKEMSEGFSTSIQDIAVKLEKQADSSKAQIEENNVNQWMSCIPLSEF
jgi:hypothetical protein